MIIKHGGFIFQKIHEACKGMWAFFSVFLADADWLGRK